jgi:NADH-quinone oxidoreductase subunit E
VTQPSSTAHVPAGLAERQHFRTTVVNLDRPGDPSVFDEQTRAEAAELMARYPAGQSRSALLPMLHLVQSVQGHVTPDGIAFCADLLELTKAQVAAVVTFYTMFKRTPTGEFLVSVCTNTLCGMVGGDEIFASLRETLGVVDNQTTADGAITLEHAECLAACDYAPVVTVNYEFFDNQTIDSAQQLVAKLRAGERPLPNRGAPICSFREIERQIAGFHTDQTLALDSPATGEPTEVGVKLALQRGESAPSYATAHDGSSAGSAQTRSAQTGSAGTSSAATSAAAQPTSSHDAPLNTSETEGKKDAQ